MKKKSVLMIVVSLVVILAIVSAAWYLSLPGEIPSLLTPAGSFPVVEVDNNRSINLTFEHLGGSGNALYEDCKILIADPQGIQYNWNLTGITWINNEAKNNSFIPGIEVRIIRSNGQTIFSTGNMIEIETQSGMLAEGNWVITLNFRPTGGIIAARTVLV
jgi:hypothetical protein